MKIIIVCNAFKNTFKSQEINEVLRDLLRKKHPDFAISTYTISDGGNGFLDSIKSYGYDYQECFINVIGSYKGKIIKAPYIVIDNTVYIESALICGLEGLDNPNPKETTTYGLGEMIKDALDKGYRNFKIGLGGSATNDMGIGMMSALGVRYLSHGTIIDKPTGGDMISIDKIDESHLDKRIKECKLEILSDVNNPLLGKSGATYTFAPQKGADEEDIKYLEKGMENIVSLIKYEDKYPGGGAAGGLGAGLIHYFHGKIVSGIKEIIKISNLEKDLKDADLFITGEGKIDRTSFSGKAISRLYETANKYNVETLFICGQLEKGIILEHYLIVGKEYKSLEDMKNNAKKDLIDRFSKYIGLEKAK